MPTQTLLDMTQEILSALSSDEVNSIGDSPESMQVATIIKRKYFDIISRAHLPEQNQLLQLTPSNDPDMPTLMYVPAEVNTIEWIKYFDTNAADGSTPNTYIHDLNLDLTSSGASAANRDPGYQYVTILPVVQFLDMVNAFNPEEDNTGSFVFTDSANGFPTGITIYYRNNCQPKYCTVIGNQYVLFDSYDTLEDSTLQSSKTMCFGQVAPSFRMEDTFIPRLDDKQFPLLLNEAKALAFYELKQTPHAKAEQEVKRQWSSLQRNKSVAGIPTAFDSLPNFGKTSTYNRGPYWYGKKH